MTSKVKWVMTTEGLKLKKNYYEILNKSMKILTKLCYYNIIRYKLEKGIKLSEPPTTSMNLILDKITTLDDLSPWLGKHTDRI